MNKLKTIDRDIYDAIELEKKRQRENIELIASENFVSLAVLEAQGSIMTNKYAEGYPNRRYYGGCEFVDIAEQLAIELNTSPNLQIRRPDLRPPPAGKDTLQRAQARRGLQRQQPD